MRLIIALCLFAAAASALTPAVQVLKFENHNNGTGAFRYAYEQSDGQRAEARGELKNEGREDESLVIVGSYSWVGPDGVTYIVKYVADENGYRPVNEHRPDYVSHPGQADILQYFVPFDPQGPSGPPDSIDIPMEYLPGTAGSSGSPNQPGPPGPPGRPDQPAPTYNLDLLESLVGK